jgi:hypothetical protein
VLVAMFFLLLSCVTEQVHLKQQKNHISEKPTIKLCSLLCIEAYAEIVSSS